MPISILAHSHESVQYHTYSRQTGLPWVFSNGQLFTEHVNMAQTQAVQTTSLPDSTAPPLATAHVSYIGLDKICLAKFEQNKQAKERSNSASKVGCQFCQKMGKEWALTFWIAWLYSHLLLQQRESFWFYSALQLSGSHLWRTTWNSLLTLYLFQYNLAH